MVEPLPKEDMKDLQAELDSYIGLATVKEEVRNLINMASVYKLRRQHDLPTTDMSLHMVFTGNPGTGKTMMARMMARIYRSLDILSKGQLVEVDRSGLVAGYVGQTAIKTQKVIQKALGGVLFIDEAYALNGKSENDFGQEAIDTILKAMEDHRDDLVVIVAGYTDLMDRFIHSNPGLESRFNRFLLFEKDYEYAAELIKKGLAYVCELTPEEFKANRGDIGIPATSPYRDRPIEENLRLFEKMKNGEVEEGKMTLRAFVCFPTVPLYFLKLSFRETLRLNTRCSAVQSRFSMQK